MWKLRTAVILCLAMQTFVLPALLFSYIEPLHAFAPPVAKSVTFQEAYLVYRTIDDHDIELKKNSTPVLMSGMSGRQKIMARGVNQALRSLIAGIEHCQASTREGKWL